MADKNIVKAKKAKRRRRRIRAKIHGTMDCPRMTVCKSLNNMFVQIIDDDAQKTLIATATNVKDIISEVKSVSKTKAAKKVGLKVAELAKEKGIEKVIFDRNRYRFHGRIKAIAEGAREGGLKF